MGVVYLAARRHDRQQVAVKTITCNGPATQRDVQRFLREASILRELRHPNVVKFHDFGQCEGQVYLSMEYVAGQDAQRLSDDLGPLSIPRATHLTCELLRALAFAHSRRFVHRDIKPANMLVFQDQGRERVKLSDFGLARVYQDSRLSGLTMQGQMGGSLAFMPPEQITNYRDAQPASDLYSVAASLYTLLTGSYVYDFPAQFSKRMLKILQEAPVPILARRRDLPRRLAAVIHRGLRRDPAARFASATAMRQALLPYSSGETA
jgi:serine/threonine-protein kinase